MKRKLPWIISLSVTIISLAVGASFHGLRTHPEDVSAYNFGCTMGTIMATAAALSFAAFIVFFVVYKKRI